MSYPRKLHTLVVEDDQQAVGGYKDQFAQLAGEFDLVPPVFARSYADASSLLNGPQFFHLVVLDLGLPIANKEVAQTGLEPGQQLLEQAAGRDDYPIPCLLVISGRLGLARLPELDDRLRSEFWYGRPVNKGIGIGDELVAALTKAQEYCDVGVHVRSATKRWVRPLVPREDDLLRRCVLAQPGCIGIDAEWWSSEDGISSVRDPMNGGATKVLMGRFLLGEGRGMSRPTFFKCEPVGNTVHADRDATLMDQKLRHVKRCWSGRSRTRGVLVTQCVTEGRPVSLEEFLGREPKEVQPTIEGILEDICDQLELLGPATDDEVPLGSLLWQWHRREVIEAALEGRGAEDTTAVVGTFDELRASSQNVWVRLRRCSHGDLNATNVAIDLAGARPRAYIFDAGGVTEATSVRDLAFLEATALLFASGQESGGAVSACRAFYADNLEGPANYGEGGSDAACVRNLQAFVAAIRRRAIAVSGTPGVYALAVFDMALLLLAGLVHQPSRNKISRPADAVEFACMTAHWLRRVAPEFFAVPGPR